MIPTGVIPIRVRLDTRRVGDAQLRRQLIHHHGWNIDRVVQERSDEAKRRELDCETKPTRIPSPFPNQSEILFIQDEKLIKLSNSRRASKPAKRRNLLIRQEINVHPHIGHTRSNHASQSTHPTARTSSSQDP